MTADAELLEVYRRTEWSVRAGGHTLRVRVGAAAPAALGSFALVTAYNPASRLCSTARNREATRRLRGRLEAAGLPWLPARAHGHGPAARRWDEPGFALVGPHAARAAELLGRSLAQNAVLVAEAPAAARLVATRDGFCGCLAGQPLPD